MSAELQFLCEFHLELKSNRVVLNDALKLKEDCRFNLIMCALPSVSCMAQEMGDIGELSMGRQNFFCVFKQQFPNMT